MKSEVFVEQGETNVALYVSEREGKKKYRRLQIKLFPKHLDIHCCEIKISVSGYIIGYLRGILLFLIGLSLPSC